MRKYRQAQAGVVELNNEHHPRVVALLMARPEDNTSGLFSAISSKFLRANVFDCHDPGYRILTSSAKQPEAQAEAEL